AKDRFRLNLQFMDDMSEFPFAPSVAYLSREREDETSRTLLDVGYDRSDPNSVVNSLHVNAYVHMTEIEEVQKLECFASSCASAPLSTFVRKIRDQVDTFNYDTYGLEARGTTSVGSLGQGAFFTYGLELYRDEVEQLRTRNETTFATAVAPGVPQPTAVTASVPDATSDTYALYLQGEVVLSDKVSIIPGIRWDFWDLEATVNTAGFNNGAGLLTDQNKDQDDDKVNPKIGFVVELMDNLNLTGNFSQGFRAPAFQELFLSSPHRPGREFIPNPNLKPEESENYDIGLKGGGEKVHFSVNYFYNQVDDFIAFRIVNFQGNPTCAPSFFPPFPSNCQEAAVNIQAATIEGVEASFDYAITPALLFYGNYTRTRGTDDLNNVPLTDISPEKALAGFLLEHECNLSWCQQFYIDLRGRFIGRPDRLGPGETVTGGYSVYDIRAGVDMSDSLRASAAVENLSDKEYQEFLSGGLTAEGINVAVNLRYRF
ncbi:MAG: TonB-dependent receptor domain-containing protein, partial [Nitrospiria bacterium]